MCVPGLVGTSLYSRFFGWLRVTTWEGPYSKLKSKKSWRYSSVRAHFAEGPSVLDSSVPWKPITKPQKRHSAGKCVDQKFINPTVHPCIFQAGDFGWAAQFRRVPPSQSHKSEGTGGWDSQKKQAILWAHLVFLIPKADPLGKTDAYPQPKGKTKGTRPFVEDACGKNILESCGKIHILKAFDYPGFKMGFCSVARVQIHPGKAGFCGQGSTMAWREG